MRLSTPSCLLLLASISLTAQADEPAVTPYRPSVSSPAQLSAAGQLEFEIGVLGSRSDGARRDSLPFLFKLAFNEQWALLLGGEAYVSAHDDAGARAHGVGDGNLVLKRAFVLDPETAFGIELGAKLPTAKDAIGSGKADYTLNTIYSRDLGKVHMDANANVTRLGALEPDTGRVQTGLSASFSTPLSEQWGVTAELSGTRRDGTASTAQVLLAAGYSPSKRLTIDFGVAHGLNAASTDWSVFSGVVIPLAKLW